MCTFNYCFSYLKDINTHSNMWDATTYGNVNHGQTVSPDDCSMKLVANRNSYYGITGDARDLCVEYISIYSEHV